MLVIVVTRLRLSDPALFDEFFASAVAVTEQAKTPMATLAQMFSPTRTTCSGHAPPGEHAARCRPSSAVNRT